jgi:hypothetical protein
MTVLETITHGLNVRVGVDATPVVSVHDWKTNVMSAHFTDGNTKRTESSLGADTLELVHELAVPVVWTIVKGVAVMWYLGLVSVVETRHHRWKWRTKERDNAYAKLCLHWEMTLSIPRLWNGAAYVPAAARRAGKIREMALIPGMFVVCSVYNERGWVCVTNVVLWCVSASRSKAARRLVRKKRERGEQNTSYLFITRNEFGSGVLAYRRYG